MNSEDFNQHQCCCCFDASRFTGEPDTAPCPQIMDVKAVIAVLDAMYEKGQENNAEEFLEEKLGEAQIMGDWRAEMTMLSELLGQYRRSSSRDKGIETVRAVIELIRAHNMGYTVSAATVMLNAATTLKCFGLSAESLPIFSHVARVYSAHLDPTDYRFAGLYNNMALSHGDIGDTESAQRYFTLALNTLKVLPNTGNDIAVTYCNMAELYGKNDSEDPRVEKYLDMAWEVLNDPTLPRDGYHAFTVSKCAPTFRYYGFFIYAKELEERVKRVYGES